MFKQSELNVRSFHVSSFELHAWDPTKSGLLCHSHFPVPLCPACLLLCLSIHPACVRALTACVPVTDCLRCCALCPANQSPIYQSPSDLRDVCKHCMSMLAPSISTQDAAHCNSRTHNDLVDGLRHKEAQKGAG